MKSLRKTGYATLASYVVKPVDFDQFSTAVGELGMYWVLVNETPRARAHR